MNTVVYNDVGGCGYVVTFSLQGLVTISLQRVDVVTISLQSSRRPVTIPLQPLVA